MDTEFRLERDRGGDVIRKSVLTMQTISRLRLNIFERTIYLENRSMKGTAMLRYRSFLKRFQAYSCIFQICLMGYFLLRQQKCTDDVTSSIRILSTRSRKLQKYYERSYFFFSLKLVSGSYFSSLVICNITYRPMRPHKLTWYTMLHISWATILHVR